MKLEQKYDVNQAWTAMLIFFDYLSRGGCSRFGKQSVEVGWFFSKLHMDPEFYYEWDSFFDKTMIQNLDNDSKLLSQSQVVDLIKVYVRYYQDTLGLNISSLVQLIVQFPQIGVELNADLTAWEDALIRSTSGEIWKLRSFEEIKEFCGDFEIHFDASMDVARVFFEFIRPEFSRFSEEANERFLCFLSALCGVYNEPEWEYCYTKIEGKPYFDQTISLFEVFQVTVAFTAQFSYEFGYNVPEFIKMLYGMNSQPKEYSENWKLWRQVGQDSTLFMNYLRKFQ